MPKIFLVQSLSYTLRGEGSFGSTGVIGSYDRFGNLFSRHPLQPTIHEDWAANSFGHRSSAGSSNTSRSGASEQTYQSDDIDSVD